MATTRFWTIWKFKDERCHCYEDHEGISQTITKQFQKSFKSDKLINPEQAINLTRDIIEADNELLTAELSDTETLEALK